MSSIETWKIHSNRNLSLFMNFWAQKLTLWFSFWTEYEYNNRVMFIDNINMIFIFFIPHHFISLLITNLFQAPQSHLYLLICIYVMNVNWWYFPCGTNILSGFTNFLYHQCLINWVSFIHTMILVNILKPIST